MDSSRGKAKFYLQQNEWGISFSDRHYSSRFHEGHVPQHHFMVISPSLDEQSKICLVSNVMKIFVQCFQFKVFVVHDYSEGHT
jgi:hypothetical protein